MHMICMMIISFGSALRSSVPLAFLAVGLGLAIDTIDSLAGSIHCGMLGQAGTLDWLSMRLGSAAPHGSLRSRSFAATCCCFGSEDEPLSFGAWQGRARGARRRSPLLLSVGVDVLIVIAFPCFGEDVDILFLGMYV